MSAPIIAIDAMGGDFGPRNIVQASLACLTATPSLHLALVGQASLIEELIASHRGVDRSRLRVVNASEAIAMDERPSQALRGKPESSMRVALELVASGEARACQCWQYRCADGALPACAQDLAGYRSAGNDTRTGHCQLLDLGANVDCSAEALYQFAVMGSVLAEILGVAQPRVALLNVGTEDIKGNQQVKQAAELLQAAAQLNYIGYVEGDGVYRGEADVVVCDGFVGNVLLKSSEGLATMIAARIDTLFNRNLLSRAVGALALPLSSWLPRDTMAQVFWGCRASS